MESECSQNVVRPSKVILVYWRSTQINPRPVLMIKEALWMDGMGWDGQLPWVIGILKAPLVLINPLIKT